MKRTKVRKTLVYIAAMLFPLTMFYYSPYVIVYAAMNSVINGSCILFLGMLVLSVFFGRTFCGYVCAGAGFGEMAGCINQKEPKLGRLRLIKYVIWVIWLAIVIYLYVTSGVEEVDPFWGTNHGISVGYIVEYIPYYIVVTLLFGVPLLFGKRAFCHYLCWMAPFMNLGMKIREVLHLPGLRVKVESDKCVHCKLCNKSCPMGLDVHKMVQEGKIDAYECAMCGDCMSSCPKKVISYGWK